MELAVVFDLGGTTADVPGTTVLAFSTFMLLLVALPVYFNRSVNHESEYVDERWGYGSIDDEWDLAVADAKLAVRDRLRELAERADARRDSTAPAPE